MLCVLRTPKQSMLAETSADGEKTAPHSSLFLYSVTPGLRSATNLHKY